ncbi:hypothetical protein G9A89_009320 [Geosiphon pyriformis]|nr:hypothetical protein G9A89_009320 [Geosiphon pyriformis]
MESKVPSQNTTSKSNLAEKNEAYNPKKEIKEIKKSLKPILELLKQVKKQSGWSSSTAGKTKFMETDDSSAKKQIRTGVGILVKKCWMHHVETIRRYCRRLLYLALKFRGKISIHIVELYMPASKLSRKKAAAKEIRKLLKDIVQNKEIIIVAGDLNEDLTSKSLEETFATNRVKECLTAITLQHMNLVDTYRVYTTNNPEKTLALNRVQRKLDYVFTNAVTALLVTNIGVIDIYTKETDQLTDEAQRKLIDNSNDNLNQIWLTIKKTVLQAWKPDLYTQKKNAWITSLVNNADMHNNNIIQLLAKWKQLKPEAVIAYLMTLLKDKLISELLSIKKEFRSTLHAKIRLQQQRQIVDNIIKRQQNFELNKEAMIKSILNRKKQRIVLDHVIKEGKFHDDSDEIKKLVNKKAQDWTRTRILKPKLCKNYVFNSVMAKIMNEKFEHILSHTPYNKAPAGPNTKSKLRTLLNACIDAANMSEDYNTSILKNTFTTVPIHVINAVAEHAKKFGNEAWFTFHDMKKAYNSVG